jgi:N,N'-diacetyllegionaminate synthase
LRAMGTIRKELGVKVGYSDHTLGTEISVAAVALGACVIEKHFTLDRDMPGPDHRASLEPHELKALVHAVRHVSAGMGDGIKRPSSSEAKNISMARKHIVALDNIHKGGVLSERNITVKRCGSGLSAMQWDKVLGKTAKKHFKKDELISL